MSGSISERERSRAFFHSPQSFTEYDRTRDGRHIITCVDPRDEISDSLKTAIQTAGGGGGVAHDASLAKTALGGRLVTRNQALEQDRPDRTRSVLDCHPDCKFERYLGTVLAGEVEPTDFTQDAIDRWASMHGLSDVVAENTPGIRDAAARKLDYINTRGQSDVLSEVDRLYPEYSNVVQMHGENNAGLYVVNHHPGLGVNRQLQHREVGLEVQAYCDSLGGSLADLSQLPIKGEERGLRATALIHRSAVARTILGASHPDMEYLEAIATPIGPQPVAVLEMAPPAGA
jgi:hypothetical protein